MKGIATLAYLDAHLLLNRARLIIRQPRRLLPWLLIVGWLAATAPFRFMSRRQGLPPSPFSLEEAGSLIPSAYLLVGALMLRSATGRSPLRFSSPADGRFLSGSALPPRLLVAWLQLRALRNLLLGAGFWFVFFIAFAGSRQFGISESRAIVGLVAGALALAAVLGWQLPLYFLQRRYPWLPLGSIATGGAGLAIVILAVEIAFLLGLAPDAPIGAVRLGSSIWPGSMVRDALAGGGAAIAGLALLAGSGMAVGSGLAGDCFPEIWESSSRFFTLRRAFRQRGGLVGFGEIRRLRLGLEPGSKLARTATSAGSGWVPAGAWTLLWKEWIVLARGSGGLRLQALVLTAAVGVGILFGQLVNHGLIRQAQTVGSVLVISLLGLNIARSLSVGADLGKPIWWLCDDDLTRRLVAWLLAGTFAQFAPLAVLLVVAGVVGDRLDLVAPLLPLILAGLCLVRAGALLAYTLIPAGSDWRGPGRALRGLLLYPALAPCVAAAITATVLTHRVWLGLLAGSGIGAVEVLGMLYLCARRLRGNGFAYAAAERI